MFGEFLRAGKREVGMRRFLHHEAGEGDGVFHGGHAGDGSAPPHGPVHDARLHLHRPLRRERRSAAGIEQRVTLQFPNLKIKFNRQIASIVWIMQKSHHKNEIEIRLGLES